jgi:hypothetical protein
MSYHAGASGKRTESIRSTGSRGVEASACCSSMPFWSTTGSRGEY